MTAVPCRAALLSTAVAALLIGGLAGVPGSAAAAEPAASLTTSAALPFDLPSTATLRASPKKVYAHYVSWSPLSIDNKPAPEDYYTRNYLSPTGENGKYVASGGKQRDRPLPRPVRTETNWRLLDAQQEVRTAAAAGLDGFVVSLTQLQGQWFEGTRTLLQAADSVDPGFSIVVRPNMISFRDQTASAVAAKMAELGAYKSSARLGDGRLIVSPYKAEEWSVSKWTSFLSTMKNTHNVPVAFWPMFHNERTHATAFDSISYGMSNWGDRNPGYNDPIPTHKDSRLGRVAAIHALGQKWMQPVSVADARPREGIYDEAENTTNLRQTWKIAIDSKSDAVHIPTWNDHAEGSQVQPTTKNDGALLDLNSYYLTWFKTGVRPAVVRDTAYLTHRKQLLSAKPTYAQTLLMRNRGGSAPRDTVEALTFLTAPARVTVQVGAKAYVCQAAAGIDTCTVPLGPGRVSVRVDRGGTRVAGTTSRHAVTSTPYVQDFDYVATSSGRRPTDGSNGTTPTTTTVVTESVSVTATADSYANAGAPNNNYGGSTSLSSRGSVAATSYLRFAVPATPTGTALTKAVLRVRTITDSAAGSADRSLVQAGGNAWTESGLTWNNRPALTGEQLGTLAAGSTPDKAYDIALTLAAVQQMVGTQTTLTVRGTGSDELRLASRNSSDYRRRPQLVLTYTPVATATTTPTSAAQTTATPAAADAYGNSAAPDAARGTAAELSAQRDHGLTAYLRFSVPATPAGKTLTRAVLRVRTSARTSAGSADGASVVLSSNTWAEGLLTWNNRPATTTTQLGTLGRTVPDTTYDVPLSLTSLTAYAGAQRTFAVVGLGADQLWLHSRESATAAYRPQLVLIYA